MRSDDSVVLHLRPKAEDDHLEDEVFVKNNDV